MNFTLLAQEIGVGNTSIKGPLVGIGSISELINKITVFIVPFASIILFFVLVMGGFDVLLSQGNPEKLKSGRAKITAGLIGFFLLVFAFGIVRLLGYILGLGENSPF